MTFFIAVKRWREYQNERHGEDELNIPSSNRAYHLKYDALTQGLTSIWAWISNYIHYKMWDEITFPFPNFYGLGMDK